MRALSIQFQPERAPELNRAVVTRTLSSLGAGMVTRVSISEGNDNGPYVDITFWAEDLATLWSLIRTEVLADPTIGPSVQRSTIVVCQGDAGWDDYLLLHHFDAAEPLDPVGST